MMLDAICTSGNNMCQYSLRGQIFEIFWHLSQNNTQQMLERHTCNMKTYYNLQITFIST